MEKTLMNQGYSFLTNIIETFQAWSEVGGIFPEQQCVWAKQLKV